MNCVLLLKLLEFVRNVEHDHIIDSRDGLLAILGVDRLPVRLIEAKLLLEHALGDSYVPDQAAD